MMEDDNEDPKEKKKKLEAKDSSSNFGFAFGGTAMLVGALIAKGIKQDEEIIEALSPLTKHAEEDGDIHFKQKLTKFSLTNVDINQIR